MNSKNEKVIRGQLIEFNKIYNTLTNQKEDEEYLLFTNLKEKIIEDLFIIEKRLKSSYKESVRLQRSVLTNDYFNKLIYDEIYLYKNNRFKALKRAVEKYMDKDNKEYLKQVEMNITIMMFNESLMKTNTDIVLLVEKLDYFYYYHLSNKVKAIISYKEITCDKTIKLLIERQIPFLKYEDKVTDGDFITICVREGSIINDYLNEENQQPFKSLFEFSSSLNETNVFYNKEQYYEDLLRNNINETVKIRLNDFLLDEYYYYLANIEEKEFKLYGAFQLVYFEKLKAILKANKKYRNAKVVISALNDINEYNNLLECIEIINNQIGSKERLKVGMIMDSKLHYETMINFKNVDFIHIDLINIIKKTFAIEEEELIEYQDEIYELFKEMTGYFSKNRVNYYLKRNFFKYQTNNNKQKLFEDDKLWWAVI